MKIEYKAEDIISYPVPGVCVGQCNENTVDKEARILKVYEGISEDGVVVDMELLDKSIVGTISGKLLYNRNYGIRK